MNIRSTKKQITSKSIQSLRPVNSQNNICIAGAGIRKKQSTYRVDVRWGGYDHEGPKEFAVRNFWPQKKVIDGGTECMCLGYICKRKLYIARGAAGQSKYLCFALQERMLHIIMENRQGGRRPKSVRWLLFKSVEVMLVSRTVSTVSAMFGGLEHSLGK